MCQDGRQTKMMQIFKGFHVGAESQSFDTNGKILTSMSIFNFEQRMGVKNPCRPFFDVVSKV